MSDHMDDLLPSLLAQLSDVAADAAARIRELEAENAQLVAAAEVLVDLGDDLANALEGDSFADADGALAAWRHR